MLAGSGYRQPGQKRLQITHELAVVHSAPGDDQLLRAARELPDPERDRRRRQRRCRRDQIRNRRRRTSSTVDELAPILFASCRFRRFPAIVRIPQQSVEQLAGSHAPSAAIFPPSSKLCLPAGQLRHQRVHHHIPRPGIERHHLIRACARRDIREIRNAADVQHGTRARFLSRNSR